MQFVFVTLGEAQDARGDSDSTILKVFSGYSCTLYLRLRCKKNTPSIHIWASNLLLRSSRWKRLNLDMLVWALDIGSARGSRSHLVSTLCGYGRWKERTDRESRSWPFGAF